MTVGGNAKTLIVLTVSSLRSHLPETISTLRFGKAMNGSGNIDRTSYCIYVIVYNH